MVGKLQVAGWVRNLVLFLVATAYIMLMAFSALESKSFINKPFPGFLVLENNLVNLIFLQRWEGYKQGIRPRDIIRAINGQKVTYSYQLYEIVGKNKPGAPLTYTVQRGNEIFHATVPVSVFTLRDYLICYLTWTLCGLAFIILGLAVIYLKPSSLASWSFLFAGVVVGFISGSEFEHCTTNINTIPIYVFPWAGPSMIVVGMHFPVVVRIRKYLLAYILLTTVPLIVFYRYYFLDITNYLKVDAVFLVHLFVSVTIGIAVMIYSFATAKDPLTRKKGKIIVYSFIVGAIGAFLTVLGSVVFKEMTFFWMVPSMLLVPMSVGYAIVKHNIFDVDVFIRRSASYLIVSGMAVFLLFAIMGLFSLLLQESIRDTSPVVAVLATLLMVGVFRPLRFWTERQIDKRFFREKYEYQSTIRKAGRLLAGIIELEQLLHHMLLIIMDAMKIERGMILLKERDRPAYKVAALMAYHDDLKPVDTKIFEKAEAKYLFDTDQPIYKHLEFSQKPIMINDIEELEEFKYDREELLRYMYDLEILLMVPVIYEHRLIGILGLAAKKSFEWYSSEDIELLQTLMLQMAVSIENAGKVEDLKKMVELETSYKELQRVNEIKDNFLTMISHDLRTPMTSIRGYASFMKKRPEQIDKDTMAEYAGIIVEESDRLTRLINDILDLQRFEAGMMQMELEDLELTVLVKQSLNLFQSVAREKNLNMEKDIPDQGIKVKGDSDKLQQVLANLLSNATKFTPEGGKIRTTVSRVTENGNFMVKVSVSDTGDGIPPEMQSKLFHKFQHADKLTKKKGEGSGLGLALVKEIIEYHGGNVGVESEPGSGSTFYFTLPIL